MRTYMSNEEKELVISLHKQGKHTVEIGNMIGRNQSTVERFLKKNGYSMNYGRRINDEQLDDIKNLYLSGLTSREIFERYNHIYNSEEAIQRIVKKLGISRNCNSYRSAINHDYFETIDCERKAYWLGFILADGCIIEQYRNNPSNRLVISLSNKDKSLLEEFLIDVGSDLSVRDYTRDCNFTDEKRICSVVNLVSNKLTSDLSKYEIVPRKSLTTKSIPDIRNDLKRHFIRGYFDGDGGATLVKPKDMHKHVLRTYFTGTKDLLAELEVTLRIDANLRQKKLIDMNKYGCNVFNLRYANNSDLTNLYHYMYEDATVYLKRKKDKFDFYFSERN